MKMKGIFISILLIVCVHITTMAQTDSVARYNNRAAALLAQDDLINARDCFKKAYSFTSDQMHEERIIIAINLSSILIDLAEYSEANDYLSKADQLIKTAPDIDSILKSELDYQRSSLMMAVGESGEAVGLLESMIQTLNADSHLYHPVTRSLLEAYMEDGRYEKVVHKADTVLRTSTTSDSLYFSRIMARAFVKMGKKSEAMKHLAVSDDVYSRVPQTILQTAQQKRLQGEVNERFGDYATAYDAYQQAATLLTGYLGNGHPETVSLLYGMAKSSLLSGNAEQAWKHYSEYLERKIDYLSSQMFRMNLWEMQSYWSRSNEGLVDAPLFCHNVKTSNNNISSALNAVMFAKSVSFDTSVGFGEMIDKTGDSTLKKDFEKLKGYRMIYSQSLRLNHKSSQQFKEAADVLEGKIRQRLYDYGLLKSEMAYPDWKKVAGKMDSKTVAVEFVDFKIGDQWQYSAFIYRKGQKAPLYIPLCTEDVLLSKISTYYLYDDTRVSDEVYDNAFKVLYEYIWAPLEKHFQPEDKICFSAAGILHNIPIEYLESDGKMFAEKYTEVRRVTVTKDIPHLQTINHIDRLEAFGAVEYFTMAKSRFSSLDFVHLPSGEEEMMSIQELFQEKTRLCIHTGIYATEADVKNLKLQPSEKNVLHLSTHGYYLPYEHTPYYPYYRSYKGDILKTHPLLRCGLAMAGANRVWRGLYPTPGSEDGILTAQEISELDLRGASLVVLSACQTGLGDMGRDGVQGFQRAFRLAGAGSMLVSLWPVNDMCTTLLTQSFYGGLANGKTAHKSLIEAIRKIKDEYSSPFYYAPFVIID